MAIKTLTLDLTAAIDKAAPLPTGITGDVPIRSISITKVPAGATFRLHLGQGDGFYIDGVGSITGIVAAEDSTRGLYYSNDGVAQPGVSVEITVGFAGRE